MKAFQLTFTALLPAAIALLATGCKSSRSNHNNSYANSPQTSQAASGDSAYQQQTPYVADNGSQNQGGAGQPQMSNDYLLHLGDQLVRKGQVERAAEVYQNILQRDPTHVLARQRLAQLNGNTSDSGQSAPMPPTKDTKSNQPPAFPATQPARSVPPAPPALQPEEPVIKQQEQSDPTQTVVVPQQKATSNEATTRVDGSQGSADEHVIRIIPAHKGGVRKVTEFRFGGKKQQQVARPEPQPSQSQPKFDQSTIPTETKPQDRKSSGPRLTTPIKPKTPKSLPKSLRDVPKVAKGDTEVVKVSPVLAKLNPELVQLATWSKSPTKNVGAISAHLTNRSPAVRSLSAYLLGRAGKNAADIVPKLDALLRAEQNGPTRVRIAEALLRIQPGHARSVRVIGDALHGSERVTRWEAICVVDILTSHDNRDAIVAGLIDRLDDPDEKIRIMAALKLGEFRSEAAAILPSLKPIAQSDKPSELRKAARVAVRVLEQAK